MPDQNNNMPIKPTAKPINPVVKSDIKPVSPPITVEETLTPDPKASVNAPTQAPPPMFTPTAVNSPPPPPSGGPVGGGKQIGDQAVKTKPDPGKAENNIDLPPVIATTGKSKTGGGSGNKKKIVATILGLLFLVGSVAAGTILVQRNQDIREKAGGWPPSIPNCGAGRYCAANQLTGGSKCQVNGSEQWCCPSGKKISNGKCVAIPEPPKCGSGLSCSFSQKSGSTQCIDPDNGNNYWCCQKGYLISGNTCIEDKMILPSCGRGLNCAPWTLTGGSKCTDPDRGDKLWCCPSGKKISKGKCVAISDNGGGGNGAGLDTDECKSLKGALSSTVNKETSISVTPTQIDKCAACPGGRIVATVFKCPNDCSPGGCSKNPKEVTLTKAKLSISATGNIPQCGVMQIDVGCWTTNNVYSMGYISHTRCPPGGCGSTTPPKPTNPPFDLTCNCTEVLAFGVDGVALTAEQLSALVEGDVVTFAVRGTASSGAITKARFTINGTLGAEITGKQDIGGVSYYATDYTIPAETTSFSVKAELYHPSVGWF